MNSKLLLYFCASSVIIWNIDAAAIEDKDIREKYSNFNGEVISFVHDNHPNNICARVLKNPDAVWANPTEEKCGNNIACKLPGDDEVITLDTEPETGVVCDFYWDSWGRDYFACVGRKCTFLEYDYED